MPLRIKPLTRTQLVGYFKAYQEAFPDWQVEHDVVLVRSQGPLKQHIAFEALRAGSYRPSCSVEVLVAPDVRLLFRFLDIKHREVLPREHATKWPKVLKAMEDQFLPPVREPLTVEQVLRLAEEEVVRDKIETLHYASGLAALNAYVGDSRRALWWCDQAASRFSAMGRVPADWEQLHMTFIQQLREAIDRGQVRALLHAKLNPLAS